MNRSQLITIIALVILIISCFTPWIRIEDPALTITGVDTTGTKFGKPGYAHFIMGLCILLCTFISKIWVKRMNLLFAAINLAWSIRNFSIIPSCDGGICPERLIGLYLVLFASIVLMLVALFPKEPPMKVANAEAQT